jgi:CopA family copper-resistance protein
LAAQTSASGQLSGSVLDLTISEIPIRVGDRRGVATAINGTVPGPLIRLREGQEVTINVTNRLKAPTSIHWHGVLVPPEMDGVPGVSFAGIKPGETFTYRFPIKQYGTYWYHSHSAGQEQAGLYAPIVFDPIKPDPVQYDREYVVIIADWTPRSEDEMISKLKKQSGYFNFQRRTVGEFAADVRQFGWKSTLDNYLMWSQMRMDATDLEDVTGATYTYPINGLTPEQNWTALFTPGQRIRLRFINVSAMTFHDVRIPGLKMTVVQADGQNVQPVEVDEFRFGPAETYDVIVTPAEGRAYTIFSEPLDRSGYARGTLAPRMELSAPIPERRPRPLRTMSDMGMSMSGSMPGMRLEMDKTMKAGGVMDHGGSGSRAGHEGHGAASEVDQAAGHNMATMNTPSPVPAQGPIPHGKEGHGSGNQIVPDTTTSQLDKPGIGLGGSERRVLVYTDLKALEPFYDTRPPQRELEIHLTGNMERFMWSFDGKKFSQAKEPIHFRFGERLRWTFVNDTMMEHTLHLHGMWMHLENGAGDYLPRKHTVIVKPAERVSVAITPDTKGPWAFHCHLIMHMAAGMFRVVEVSDQEPSA